MCIPCLTVLADIETFRLLLRVNPQPHHRINVS